MINGNSVKFFKNTMISKNITFFFIVKGIFLIKKVRKDITFKV